MSNRFDLYDFYIATSFLFYTELSGFKASFCLFLFFRMSSSVCGSMAWPGTHTAGVCPTESCPTSTEAAPRVPGRATCPPTCQHTQHQEPGLTWHSRACTLPCSELRQAGVNSLIGGWSKKGKRRQNGVEGLLFLLG